MLPRDVTRWYWLLMLPGDVTRWYWLLVLPGDVTCWCYPVILTVDVAWWCYLLMLPCDIDCWCCLVMLPRDIDCWCCLVMLPGDAAASLPFLPFHFTTFPDLIVPFADGFTSVASISWLIAQWFVEESPSFWETPRPSPQLKITSWILTLHVPVHYVYTLQHKWSRFWDNCL